MYYALKILIIRINFISETPFPERNSLRRNPCFHDYVKDAVNTLKEKEKKKVR